MTRSRRSMCGGNSSFRARFSRRALRRASRRSQQFPIDRFVRLRLRVMISCSSALGGSGARRSPTAADRETRCDARSAVPTACPPAGCWRLPVPPPASPVPRSDASTPGWHPAMQHSRAGPQRAPWSAWRSALPPRRLTSPVAHRIASRVPHATSQPGFATPHSRHAVHPLWQTGREFSTQLCNAFFTLT